MSSVSTSSKSVNRNRHDAAKKEQDAPERRWPYGGAVDQLRFHKNLRCDHRLNETELRVGLAISDLYIHKNGYTFASLDFLARDTGCPRRNVARAVKRLCELGLFTKDAGRTGKSNRFHPAFPPPPPGGDVEAWGPSRPSYGFDQWSQWHSTSGSSGTGGVVPVALLTSYSSSDLRKKKNKNTPSGSAAPIGAPPVGNGEDGDRQVAGDLPDFDAFWDACPKKAGKENAREAYAHAMTVDGVTPKLLLAMMKEYDVKADHSESGKWLKHPANWLRLGWWDATLWPSKKERRVRPTWDRGKYVWGLELETATRDKNDEDDKTPNGVQLFSWHKECPFGNELEEFDVIVQVNGKTVKTPDNVRRCLATARADGDREVVMFVKRMDRETEKWVDRHVDVRLPDYEACAVKSSAPALVPAPVEPAEAEPAEVEPAAVEPAPVVPDQDKMQHRLDNEQRRAEEQEERWLEQYRLEEGARRLAAQKHVPIAVSGDPEDFG